MTDFNTLTVTDFTPEPLVPETKPVPQKTNRNVAQLVPRLVSTLEATESHDYQTWIKFGHALKYEGERIGQEGLFFELWVWWSTLSYKSRDCDFEAKWTSFKPKGDITIGSILHREPKEGIQFQRLDEFLKTNHEVEYLVEGILAKEQPCFVAAPPKSFKTTLILYLGLCLAAGDDFLGRRCKKCSVAFVSGESGLAAIQKAIMRQLAAMQHKPDRFFLTDQLPRFDQPLDAWKTALSKLDVDVLIIDPLYLCMDGSNAGNLFEMGPQLKNVADLASDLGITLILVHHFNKAASRENRPPQLSDMTQAGFSEFARQWILLSHREPYERGYAKLYLNVGGSAGHSDQLRIDIQEDPWLVKAISNSQHAREQKEAEYCSIVDLVRERVNEPMSKSRIRELCKLTRSQIDRFFQRLVDDVVLVERGTKNGHPTYVREVCRGSA